MPYRVLTTEQLADYLHVSATDIEDLVHRREIPFERQGCRIVFRRQAIDEWASRRILGLSGKRLESYHQGTSVDVRKQMDAAAIVTKLLPAPFIEPALGAKTRASAIRDVAELAGRTGLVVDAADLAGGLRDREDLCSTAMPGGFALLHPRRHDPYMFDRSFLMLARTAQGLPFGAPDGGETRFFFLICCQEDQLHLHVLARLSMMCSQTDLLARLRAAETREEMAAAIADSEAKVMQTLKP